MENITITLMSEQIAEIKDRAEALGISFESYCDQMTNAWLTCGEELTIEG